MALTLTLAQTREEVGLALDIPTGDAYLTSVTLQRWVFMAVQEYAALRAQYGLMDEKRTTLTGSVSTTPGTDGFPANELLSLPADFGSVVALNYNLNGTQYPLRALAETDRQKWWGTPLQTLGPPEAYAVIDATPSLPARARVWPPMQTAYTFELIYRPTVVAMAVDADTWEYLPGTEDYVICTVALKQATREGVQEPAQFQALQMRKQNALEALQRMSARAGGTNSMRDTRGMARANRVRQWF